MGIGGICFIIIVPNRSKETLLPIMSEKILPGTTIISDQWWAYNLNKHTRRDYSPNSEPF